MLAQGQMQMSCLRLWVRMEQKRKLDKYWHKDFEMGDSLVYELKILDVGEMEYIIVERNKKRFFLFHWRVSRPFLIKTKWCSKIDYKAFRWNFFWQFKNTKRKQIKHKKKFYKISSLQVAVWTIFEHFWIVFYAGVEKCRRVGRKNFQVVD